MFNIEKLKTSYCKKVIMKYLNLFDNGKICIIEKNDYNNNFDKKAGTIIIHNDKFYPMTLIGGSVGAGEAFIRGYWSSPNLSDTFTILINNEKSLEKFEGFYSKISSSINYIKHLFRQNNKKKAKKNIELHYDLGNDLFESFLCSNMMYSSAIFPDINADLEKAQQYRLEMIAKRLSISPEDHVLEIGTGWGGLSIYLAKNFGCKVTTTTISKEQYNYAKEWIKREKLDNKINILLKDYRDLPKDNYNKLVSIEMIEAVGKKYISTYIQKCHDLLEKDGKMLIQAITMPENRFKKTSNRVDFIQQFIFPGGFLPSHSQMLLALEKNSLQLKYLTDISDSYARTLRCWLARFKEKYNTLDNKMYDEKFYRMWQYYLIYCAVGFEQKSIQAVQMVFEKT